MRSRASSQLGTGTTPDSLINDTWTADQLRPKLLGAPKKDLIYLAGHFDAGVAYAADTTTTVSATELIPASVNMTNTLVFSTGCHAGYNVVDADGISGVTPPDWAQVLASKGATLVAGTGFQYGDDELIEYSERIYAEFAHQLRVGTGAVSVGNALVQSKLAYLRATPEIKGMHEKALLTASVFGLPMFSINMGGARDTTAAGGSQVTTNNTLGVTSGDLALDEQRLPGARRPGVRSERDDLLHRARRGRVEPRRAGSAALRRQRRRVRQGPPRCRVPERDVRRDGGRQAIRRRARHGVRRRSDSVHLDDLLSVADVDRELLRRAQRWRHEPRRDACPAPRPDRGRLDRDPPALREPRPRLFYADANDSHAALATAPAISDVGASLTGLHRDLQRPRPRHG